MKIPESCAECPYTSYYHAAHYGGSKCTYEKQITEKILAGSLYSQPK